MREPTTNQQFTGYAKKARWYLAALLLLGVFFAPSAMAASQQECAIWLCLPGGFGPAACGPAHSAMKERIAPPTPEPPLPPFSECSADGGKNGLSYARGIAAHVPKQKTCTQWREFGHAGEKRCVAYRAIEEHWEKGKYCMRGYVANYWVSYNPDHNRRRQSNIRCDQQKRFITIFQHGNQLGNTYFWQR